MLFLQFKDFLNEKNIFLFDSEYRVAYQRLINTKELLNNLKFGGGDNNKICKNPFYLVKSKEKDDIEEIIKNLLNNNYQLVLKKFNF
jgi:hypothetical protein